MKAVCLTVILLLGVAFGQSGVAENIRQSAEILGQPVVCDELAVSHTLSEPYTQQLKSQEAAVACYAVFSPVEDYQAVVNTGLVSAVALQNVDNVMWGRGIQGELYVTTLKNFKVQDSFHLFRLPQEQTYLLIYSWGKQRNATPH